jgi:flagellar motor switch protein FliN/FliY
MASELRDIRFSGQTGLAHAGLAHAGHPEMGSTAQARDSGAATPSSAAGLVANGGLRRDKVTHGAGEPGNEVGQLLVLTPAIERLPVELTVAIPVRDFRVRDLLAMALGVVIETQWTQGEDVPLSSGEVQLAWSEFEVVDTRLAVRVTRLG